MKKYNYYLIGGLLLIAGLVWYFVLRKPKPTPPPGGTTPGGSTPTGGTTGGTTGGGGTTGTGGTTTGAPNFVGVGMTAKVAKAGYPVYFQDISDDWSFQGTAQPDMYTSSQNMGGVLGVVQEIKDFNEYYNTPYPRKKFARLFYQNGETIRPVIWVEVDAISQA